MSVVTQDSVKVLMSKQDYVTGIETCEFTYEWVINDVKNDPIEIKSPKFSSHYSDFNDEWILEIDPNCKILEGVTCLSIQLHPTSFNEFNDTSQLQTECKIISIVDKDVSKEYYFSDLKKKVYWLVGHFGITLNDALNNEYFRNLEFKICCKVRMSRKLKNHSVVILTNIATPQLKKDWKNLLLNEKSADVTIQVGQKSFRAIKGILGARSPVFAAMFDYEQLKENEKNEVVIEDIDEDVFEEFLHYIYTDESPNIDKMPMELLAVAEKYQVNRLKKICEAIICKTINFDNFASRLVCSDIYKLEELNKKCLKFIKENLQAILSSKTFNIYKKKHPEIFMSVLENLLSTTTPQKPVSSCNIL